MPAADQATDTAAATPLPQSFASGIAKINSTTGLSTDYLNHFTEAIMVLEMITMMPECVEDLQAWQPKSYREHFAESRFSDRAEVIAAYEAADPAVRDALDSAAETLNRVLLETRDVVIRNLATPSTADVLAQRAVTWLKPLVARTAAVINGTATGKVDRNGVQATVDALFIP